MNVISCKDDGQSLKGGIEEYYRKFCEVASLSIDQQLKKLEADRRMELAKSPPEHLLHLKYSLNSLKHPNFNKKSKPSKRGGMKSKKK